MTSMLRFVVVASLIGCFGCGDDGPEPLALEDGCQPLLGGADCLLPYPSDFFRVADPSMATGYRVEVSGAARMITDGGEDADVHGWLAGDGFALSPLIVAILPFEIQQDGFVGILDDPEDSTSPTSRSLVIEADTGRLIPHFVDLDPDYDLAEEQAISIHPLIRLDPDTRYVVALRDVRGADGQPVPAAEGFARLRDARGTGDPDLAGVVDHFDTAVFPVVEAAGVPREQLQLAWDFTTRSAASASADLMTIRAATLAWLEGNSPVVTIDEVVDDDGADIWRTVYGTIEGPKFMDVDEPGGALVRGTDGQVVQDGTTTFEFIAQIPAAVRDAGGPARALAFGHGFFGTADESTGDAVQGIATRLGAVTFAIDWVGMSRSDQSFVSYALAAEPANALAFSDRAHQGIANWLVFTAAIRGVLADQPELQDGAGAAYHDAGPVSFLGISMGHFLGGVMVAINPDIERACFNAGGAGIVHLMTRSAPFGLFVQIMRGPFPDPLERQKFMATTALPFERIDGLGYTDLLMTGDRRVLMQVGVGDASVPNFASFNHARALGLSLLDPAPYPVWGLEPATAPFDGSALATYDFGVDPALYEPPWPPPANDVHEQLRRTSAALDQLDAFFGPDGTITQPCDGVCDPE